MSCKSIIKAKAGKLTFEELRESIMFFKSFSSSGMSSLSTDVSIGKCQCCQNSVVRIDKQYTSPSWEDDYWTFFFFVGKKTVNSFGAKGIDKLAKQMVLTRPHICLDPNRKVSYNEKGSTIAESIF